MATQTEPLPPIEGAGKGSLGDKAPADEAPGGSLEGGEVDGAIAFRRSTVVDGEPGLEAHNRMSRSIRFEG